MKINNEVIKKLRQGAVHVDTALLYLLSIYHNLDTDLFKEGFRRRIHVLNIVERDFDNNSIKWTIPLFEGQEIKWEWVEDYRKLFRNKKLDKGGTLKGCISKMKKFFGENPEVRKQDVLDAAKMYLGQKNLNTQYIQRADYFIIKGKGADRTSRLEEYLEILYEKRKQGTHKTM